MRSKCSIGAVPRCYLGSLVESFIGNFWKIIFLSFSDCDTITKKAVALEIDSEFYNKNLSDPKKIQATSESRHLVNVVERVSMEWMRVIEKILIKGKVIRRNVWNTGPIGPIV